jgi:hypothetical protein
MLVPQRKPPWRHQTSAILKPLFSSASQEQAAKTSNPIARTDDPEFGASVGTTTRRPSALPSRSCVFATADLLRPSPPILVIGLRSLSRGLEVVQVYAYP